MFVLAQQHVYSNDWQFWIEVAIWPLLMLGLVQLIRRMRSNDERLEGVMITMARTEERMKGLGDKMDETRKDLALARDKISEIGVEGSGLNNELRVQIEREFVRKEEFARHEAQDQRRHVELMNAINELKRGSRR